jgi:hypothetical protein
MIVQFILKLIFFYCLFSLLRSLFQRYTKPATPNNYSGNARRSPRNDSNVFEAEYKVVNEEKDS